VVKYCAVKHSAAGRVHGGPRSDSGRAERSESQNSYSTVQEPPR
jgi:hypothetical protein